jgi:hypothetical protein
VSMLKASWKRFSLASTTAQWLDSIVHALTFCGASSFRARVHLPSVVQTHQMQLTSRAG